MVEYDCSTYLPNIIFIGLSIQEISRGWGIGQTDLKKEQKTVFLRLNQIDVCPVDWVVSDH